MGGFISPSYLPHRGKMLHQHAVDEDVATTHAAQKDALGGVVQEFLDFG